MYAGPRPDGNRAAKGTLEGNERIDGAKRKETQLVSLAKGVEFEPALPRVSRLGKVGRLYRNGFIEVRHVSPHLSCPGIADIALKVSPGL